MWKIQKSEQIQKIAKHLQIFFKIQNLEFFLNWAIQKSKKFKKSKSQKIDKKSKLKNSFF